MGEESLNERIKILHRTIIKYATLKNGEYMITKKTVMYAISRHPFAYKIKEPFLQELIHRGILIEKVKCREIKYEVKEPRETIVKPQEI